MFSGLSVFVNAGTTIHVEIGVGNFQLEQNLSAINQLDILSPLLNLHSAPRILNSAHFTLPWPCIVCHYRWLRSPTRLPLTTINQPFRKSVYIDSSYHAPFPFWIAGSAVQGRSVGPPRQTDRQTDCTNRYTRELRTARFHSKHSTSSSQSACMCFLRISGKNGKAYCFPVRHRLAGC